MKKKKRLLIIISLLVSAMIVWYWHNNRVQLEMTTYGELIVGTEGSGMVIREEKVFYSSHEGEISLQRSEGERVGYGDKVAQISTEAGQKSIYAGKAGILSFAVDGLEDKLSSENLTEDKVQELKEESSDYSHLVSGHSLSPGDEIYRIVDNQSLKLVVFLPVSWQDNLNEGEEVLLQPANTDIELSADVQRIFESEDELPVLLETRGFVERWLNKRDVEVKLIKSIHRGIKVPRDAIFSRPDGRGVLKAGQGGRFKFTEVSVIASDGESAVVEGINIGEQIIVNPEVMDYGRRE